AMNNCTDEQYWDSLVCQCIPCSLVCGRPTVQRCAALCESMDCNSRDGFYYDKLLRNCINCTAVCGQHPKQCARACEGTAGVKHVKHMPEGFLSTHICSWPTAGAVMATPPPPAALATASSPLVLEQKACMELEPWLVVYLLLGLCLCALLCSLLLGWTHLRRKGEVVSTGSFQAPVQHCIAFLWYKVLVTPLKLIQSLLADRLVEAGSVGDGSTGSRLPEPVETCGFCFPGHGSAVQETKSCHSTSCHIGERAVPSHTGICSTGRAGAIPSPDDGRFKIICSPSQEKTPM
ncbi:Tumor necrosis factor receptor superfamily member 13B, partial [Colius striatus]